MKKKMVALLFVMAALMCALPHCATNRAAEPARVEPAKTELVAPKAGDEKTIGGMEFVYIPAGSFMMGSPWGEGDNVEHPRHRVSVDGFWMGRYEVTQSQYEEIMGTNPSNFKGWFGGNHPVEMVNWYDAVEFCNRLSEKAGLEPCYTIDRTRRDPNNMNQYDRKGYTVTLNDGANGFRLPTEAEWEYAARAGSSTLYYWGDRIDGNYLWYRDNSNRTTHRVGEKRPNAFGLYDMSGNVYEWCADWYDGIYYARSPEKNPKGPESGYYRVLRGGSSLSVDDSYYRSAFRFWEVLGGFRLPSNGFRVVVPSAGQ